MFYNILEQIYTIMMENCQNCIEQHSFGYSKGKYFPGRPEEAAMFGCKSLSI